MAATGTTQRTVRAPKNSLLNRLVWRAHRVGLGAWLKALLSLWNAEDKSRRRGIAQQLAPDAGAERASDQLRDEGWTMATGFADASLLEELRAAGEARVRRVDELARKQGLTHKSFWVRLLDADLVDGRFPSDSIFVRFATQPGIVQLLTRYLGELPILVDVILTLSRDTNTELGYSQLWHRDYDDSRTLKVFVYLTDVNDTRDGPFTFLPGQQSDRIGITLRSHLPDAKVFSRVERTGTKEMLGAAHTTFVCQTSRCLHMGSRVAPGRSRLMYTATYVPAPMTYPAYEPKFSAAGALDTTERLLLGL